MAASSSKPSESAPGTVLMAADRRIQSLDGLRAISIGAVVVGHLAGTVGLPTLVGDIVRNNGFIDVANLGVRVFFVTSGLLITGILMKESGRPGGISLRRFNFRRTNSDSPRLLGPTWR